MWAWKLTNSLFYQQKGRGGEGRGGGLQNFVTHMISWKEGHGVVDTEGKRSVFMNFVFKKVY